MSSIATCFLAETLDVPCSLALWYPRGRGYIRTAFSGRGFKNCLILYCPTLIIPRSTFYRDPLRGLDILERIHLQATTGTTLRTVHSCIPVPRLRHADREISVRRPVKSFLWKYFNNN